MSRGAWVLIIGVIMMIGAGVLFVYSTLLFLPDFTLQEETLASGGSFNETVVLQEGGILTYYLVIQNYSAGDELSFSILAPGQVMVAQETVTGSQVTSAVVAESAGSYAIVIQNSGASEVTFSYFAGEVDLSSAALLAVSLVVGVIGLIVIVVGIVLLIIDRRR